MYKLKLKFIFFNSGIGYTRITNTRLGSLTQSDPKIQSNSFFFHKSKQTNNIKEKKYQVLKTKLFFQIWKLNYFQIKKLFFKKIKLFLKK